jgi:endoglucanase
MRQIIGWKLGVVMVAVVGYGGEPVPKPSEPAKTREAQTAFVIHRGVNVSHWLSQSEDRGAERAAKVTAADFAAIAGLGFDHVRLPVDEEQLWDEAGKQHPEAFQLLHDAIGWSLQNKLRVIVDLHVLRSHHFNRPDSRRLWEDPEAQATFIGLWEQLSGELKRYPLDKVAYEPLNEAVAEDPEDWNKLINKVIAALRALEPERVIVVGSNRWQIAQTFPDLKVPANDPNLILSFHFYTPMPVTHYRASWTNLAAYEGPVSYPGQAIDESQYQGMDEKLIEAVKQHNGVFDQAVLEAAMKPAIDVAKQHKLRLYCGEWGAFPTTPIEVRQRLYRDMVGIFDRNDIAWAHWNYKDDFPLVTQDLKPIRELVDILVPAEPTAAP